MPRGRKAGPGTPEEKRAARRAQVRLNVQAFRNRQRGTQDDTGVQVRTSLKWIQDKKWQPKYSLQQQQVENVLARAEEDEVLLAIRKAGSECSSDTATLIEEEPSPAPKTLALIGEINPVRVYTHSLVGMLPRKFLPLQLHIPSVQNATIRTPCALWVSTACYHASNEYSSSLADVLLAISLAIVGRERGRQDLELQSRRLYSRSLQKTRQDVKLVMERRPTSEDDLVNLFLSCHASSILELMINHSVEDMSRHIRGIALLVQHQRSLPGFPTLIRDSLIEEYRLMEIFFCLMERRRTTGDYMKKTKHVPGATCSVFTAILDLADQIPPLMVQLDAMRTNPRPMHRQETMKLFRKLLKLHGRIEEWSNSMRAKSLPQSTDPPGDYRDVKQVNNYEFATVWLFTLSYDFYVMETCTEAVDFLASLHHLDLPITPSPSFALSKWRQKFRDKGLALAETILQLKDFFLRHDKGMVGRSVYMWPLESARVCLDNELRRFKEDSTSDQYSYESHTLPRKEKILRFIQEYKEAVERATSYGLPPLYPGIPDASLLDMHDRVEHIEI